MAVMVAVRGLEVLEAKAWERRRREELVRRLRVAGTATEEEVGMEGRMLQFSLEASGRLGMHDLKMHKDVSQRGVQVTDLRLA